jgi:hemolysin D
VREFLTGKLLTTFLDLITLFVLLPVLFYLNAILASIVLVCAVAISLIILAYLMPLRALYMRVVAAETWKAAALGETIVGIKTVKSLGLEPQRRALWDERIAEAGKRRLAFAQLANWPQVSRLQAEAGGQPFAYSGPDPSWLLQASIHEHRIAEFDSKLENYRHRGDELASVISRAESDATSYRERLGIARTVEQMRKQLEVLQAGSKLQMLAATDSRAEMERSLAYAQQTAEGAKRDQSALESERNAYVQGWRADVSQKLAEANGRFSDAREQLNKAKLRRQLVEMRSELDAVVQSVAKVSVGSVLQSGQQFITLVPADAPLEVEGNIFGRDNGFVHVGDPVAVKFDTFPYSQYGMAEGTVRTISPNSFTAQDEARNPTSALPMSPATAEPFYRTRIAIDRVALHGVPEQFQVIPGMPVTADIKVGYRTVLKYLLGMVVPLAREGMREP